MTQPKVVQLHCLLCYKETQGAAAPLENIYCKKEHYTRKI